MIRLAFGTTLVAAILLTSPALAQATGDLQPGQRVRVTQETRHRTVGVIQSLSPDALAFIDEEGMLVRVPMDEISRVELHVGRHRRFGRDFLMTTAVSAGVFGLLSAATYQPCRSDELFGCFLAPTSAGDAFLWGAAGGGVLGIPLGVVVGLVAKHDRWVEVIGPGSPDGATLRVVPAGGGRVGLVGSIPVRW